MDLNHSRKEDGMGAVFHVKSEGRWRGMREGGSGKDGGVDPFLSHGILGCWAIGGLAS